MGRRERVRRVLGPTPPDDVDDELSFHLEMRIRELIEQGETLERARRLAMRRLATTTARAANVSRSMKGGGAA